MCIYHETYIKTIKICDYQVWTSPSKYEFCAYKSIFFFFLAPAPPKRDPKTTLSVGRVRARSMVAGLAEIGLYFQIGFYWIEKSKIPLKMKMKMCV